MRAGRCAEKELVYGRCPREVRMAGRLGIYTHLQGKGGREAARALDGLER
jgi:hypothetical protein